MPVKFVNVLETSKLRIHRQDSVVHTAPFLNITTFLKSVFRTTIKTWLLVWSLNLKIVFSRTILKLSCLSLPWVTSSYPARGDSDRGKLLAKRLRMELVFFSQAFFYGLILLLTTKLWKPIQSLEANPAPRTFLHQLTVQGVVSLHSHAPVAYNCSVSVFFEHICRIHPTTLQLTVAPRPPAGR